jgi:hypothetical protein
MSGFTVDMGAFKKAAGRMVNRLDKAGGVALRRLAFDVVSRTASTWPVDTGRSRAAWGAALKQMTTLDGYRTHQVIVTNPVGYAIWIEYGTAATPPGQHLQRAIREARRDFSDHLAASARRRGA